MIPVAYSLTKSGNVSSSNLVKQPLNDYALPFALMAVAAVVVANIARQFGESYVC